MRPRQAQSNPGGKNENRGFFYRASNIGALKCQTNNGEKPMAFKTKNRKSKKLPEESAK